MIKQRAIKVKDGDVVVVRGLEEDMRVLFRFTNAKAMVDWFRARDCETAFPMDNASYIHKVAAALKERYNMELVASNSEEAFIESLFRIGVCETATLN